MTAAIISRDSKSSGLYNSNKIATDCATFSSNISHDTTDKPVLKKYFWERDEAEKNIFQEMKYESNRLHSFKDRWPVADVTPESLAEAGFFYLQQEDRVQCPFCYLVLCNWTRGDKPLREHMRNQPKCGFLLGLDVGNVPFLCGKSKEMCFSSTSEKKLPSKSIIVSYKPKHPRMADIKKRILTFSGWPLSKPEPHQLAECGLYYSGLADVVTCFFCGGTLGNWEPDDDPWNEHTRFFPDCSFLAVSKNKHIRPGNIQTHEKKLMNPKTSLINTQTSSGIASDIIKQALDIFPEHLVLDAMKNNGGISSLQELCDDILERTQPSHKTTKVVPVREDSGSETGTSSQDTLLCKLCMDRERGVVFQPCGHLISCWQCSNLISDCPVCRSPIICKIKTYLS